MRFDQHLRVDGGEEIRGLGGVERERERGLEAPATIRARAGDLRVVGRAEIVEGALDGDERRSLGADRSEELLLRETGGRRFRGAA